MSIEDYMVCVGPNGSGKSTTLHAIGWFFGHPMVANAEPNRDRPDDDTSVSLTFSDLGSEALDILGPYVSNGSVTLTRYQSTKMKQTRYAARRRIGPGFDAVRRCANAESLRLSYEDLCVAYPSLPTLPKGASKEKRLGALADWEANTENSHHLVEGEDPIDFLFNQERPIDRIARFVFIQGSSDLSSQVGSISRGTALTDFTSSLVTTALARAKKEWEEVNSGALDDLKLQSRQAISTALDQNQKLINENLKRWIPQANLELVATEPLIDVKNDSRVTPNIVGDNGAMRDITNEGDGVQRAVLMAMIQSKADLSFEDGNEEPLVILTIEEPELFQHPSRARTFARALTKFAESPGSQVLIATHNPYFIRPEQFHALRRMSIQGSATSVSATTLDEIAARCGTRASKLKRLLRREIPKGFSECFFSEGVVLVEGDTDVAVIDVIVERLYRPLDGYDISLWSVDGIMNLFNPYHILNALGCRVYAIADADWAKDEKNPEVIKSRKKALGKLITAIPPIDDKGDEITFEFGSESVIARNICIWKSRIEEVLLKWDSFIAIRGVSIGKDAARYRLAAEEANLDDLPFELRQLAARLIDFAENMNSGSLVDEVNDVSESRGASELDRFSEIEIPLFNLSRQSAV